MSVQGLRFNLRVGAILVWCALMTACSSTLRTAPIIERSAGTNKPAQPATPVQSPRTAPVAATTNAGDSNGPNYVVKKGDTLYSIALEFGQDYREIASWNQLDDVNMIKVGQSLRVVPPENAAAVANTGPVVSTPVIATPALESKPLTATPLPPVAAKPEAAVICTPAHLHIPMATKLAEQGTHLLIEKPLATDLASARTIADAAARHGRQVAVFDAHQRAARGPPVERGALQEDALVAAVAAERGVHVRADVDALVEGLKEVRRIFG